MEFGADVMSRRLPAPVRLGDSEPVTGDTGLWEDWGAFLGHLSTEAAEGWPGTDIAIRFAPSVMAL